LIAAVSLLACTSSVSTGSGAAEIPFSSAAAGRAQGLVSRVSAPEKCASARRALRFYQRRSAEQRSKMGAPKTSTHRGSRCPRYLAKVWRAKARAARAAFEAWFEFTYAKWRCIHEHEGAWNANTGNGYYGGLQMTSWFQRTYGREFVARYGSAERWPVWAQLRAAERAWRECRCFRQWGTRGLCGLA
jgi:hypothetical protein